MKKLMMVVMVTLSLSASASFFQETCSSADGSVVLHSGMVLNKLVVKETVIKSGYVSEREVELDRSKMDLTYTSETMIKDDYREHCNESGSGFVNWKKVIAKEVVISHRDGSLFSDTIKGVSQDGSTIKTYLLCDNSGNSMIYCEGN